MNWHINFVILAVLSALLWLLVWRYLPETSPGLNPRALEPARLWRNYKRPLAAPDFMFYAVIGGCCMGVVYTGLIGAPDLVLNVLGMGTFAIVIVSVAVLIGFVVGAGLCAWLSKRVRDLYLVSTGLAVLLAGSFALLAVALIAGKQGTLAMFLTPIGFCFTGVGLVMPVSTNRAMAPFDEIAGAASSLLGFTRMGIAAVGTIAMSLLHNGSVYDMPIVFLGLSGSAAVIFVAYVARRRLAPVQ